MNDVFPNISGKRGMGFLPRQADPQAKIEYNPRTNCKCVQAEIRLKRAENRAESTAGEPQRACKKNHSFWQVKEIKTFIANNVMALCRKRLEIGKEH